MRKGNISIFVPHLGCPCQCSFCNQHIISGQTKAPTADTVRQAVEKAFEKDGFSYEIAFFGGSFTAIDRDYMCALLQAAYPYVKSERVEGIRISTRPDAIDAEVLALLKAYGVTSIELGAQSMEDAVLTLNRRGHTAADVEKAAELIHSFGFECGLQMMTGLYGDTNETAIKTAEKLIALSPDTVRIYPAVVLKGTYLAQLYKSGQYRPQTVEEAVDLCADLAVLFAQAGVRILRMGLHASADIKENQLAGAFHDCFGELVHARLMLRHMLEHPAGDYTVTVSPKSVSRMVGNKRQNLLVLADKGYQIKIKTDAALTGDEMRIEHGIKNVRNAGI